MTVRAKGSSGKLSGVAGIVRKSDKPTSEVQKERDTKVQKKDKQQSNS
jgi:hypothetical protein